MNSITWKKTGWKYEAVVDGHKIVAYEARFPNEGEKGTHRGWALDVDDELECAIVESASVALLASTVRTAIDEFMMRTEHLNAFPSGRSL